MNILLIDNGTIRLGELEKLIRNYDSKTINFGDIKNVSDHKFDLIILSGSSRHPVAGSHDIFQDELLLIKNSNTPILGICLGFELICHAYGAKMHHMENKENDIIDINITRQDNIFSSLPNLKVYEAHRWVIKKSPPGLTELARSKDGIEAIKHKYKKIYGFQFHPEVFPEKTCGDEIFYNLVNQLNENK